MWCIEYHTRAGHRRVEFFASENRYCKAIDKIAARRDFIDNTYITETNWKGDNG